MREFFYIFVAALGCSVLGAGGGWLIGRFAPEMLTVISPLTTIESPAAVATALGAINGLLLGAAAMAGGLLIGAIRSRSAGRA
jgi:hypothetical protein